jgi:hypothetical protein
VKLNSLILFLTIKLCFAVSDLSIVGPIKFNDGIFRLPLVWIEQLKNDLTIDYVSTGYIDLNGISQDTKGIINLAISDRFKEIINQPANVGIFLSSPWTLSKYHDEYMTNNKVKIAYSMLESDCIPDEWVHEFNSKFDAVVVPDKYLINVYINSGVKKPIFVLPCGLFLQDFLNQPLKKNKNNIFRFGCSATFSDDKNQKKLLEAFIKCFGNNKKVELYLHGRGGDESSLVEYIKKNNIKNVIINKKSMGHNEYIDLFKSFDCYVLLSKGEGFSITPREAMALGIPCILSNNTAHISICETGLVEAVESLIVEPSYYFIFGKYVGNKFDCNIDDVCFSLRKVYNNYESFLDKSLALRDWALKFNYKNLKNLYLSLVKPKKIQLGEKNHIAEEVLITNSIELIEKYKFFL